jgi:hypothetical protein
MGLRLGAARRFLRLHPHHHRHGGPEEAGHGWEVLAARHERGRWREGELAHQEWAVRAPSRHHPRRHRLLPLPKRNLLVVVDETVLDNQEDGFKPIWIFDNQVKANPISISTFPEPSDKDYLKVGGHFGPHNVHENRPGSFVSEELIFSTYQNAGLRVYDIKDQFRPKEVAAFVPPTPTATWVDPRPNRPIVLHSADVFVDKNALCYVTDFNAGLYIVEYKG